MHAATITAGPNLTTADICAALVSELRAQGVLGAEALRWELRELDANHDDDADGWWWTGEVFDDTGEHVANMSAPDWYLDGIEITWAVM